METIGHGASGAESDECKDENGPETLKSSKKEER
jgi:hypothetical protein